MRRTERQWDEAWGGAWVPLMVGVGALMAGALVMAALFALGKGTAEASLEREEKPIHVQVAVAEPRDVPVTITGYGQARALKTVDIIPEVSGKVIETHPNLHVGGIVPEGEILFRIDPRPYEARVAEARAQVARYESSLDRLRTEQENEARRLTTLDRSLDLSRGNRNRAAALVKEGIGSQNEADAVEEAYLSAKSQRDSTADAVSLYPARIRELESELAASRARLDVTLLDADSTRVMAPFTARVKSVSIETDQFVTPGIRVLTIVDDSVLEIPVALDSQDAKRWLRFGETPSAPGAAWFSELDRSVCGIQWTEEDNGHRWEGTLHRIEAYDSATRTVTAVVRVEGAQMHAEGERRFPLVDGMFCKVAIPGRPMRGVYQLPQSAVSFEDTVFVSIDNRLKTVPVETVRVEGGYTYIDKGLNPGDLVITTRLVNPLDQSLLEVTKPDAGDAQ
ncbi:MAG: HlyD family efflux transporter periplasmic adaptor subunit [Nitrospiraceae bacterium]|nr:HlyD family efflux transporter periplasmic adaptor subunit [Nitrospiraceae bacterium]